MELRGKVINILPMQSGVSRKTGNQWAKQEYVIEIPDRYPKHVCFEVFGDSKIKEFNIQPNEEIIVSFEIDASEYKGRWYNKIQAWRVDRPGVAAPQPQPAQYAAAPVAQQPTQQVYYTQAPAQYQQPAPVQYQQQQAPPQYQQQPPMQQGNLFAQPPVAQPQPAQNVGQQAESDPLPF